MFRSAYDIPPRERRTTLLRMAREAHERLADVKPIEARPLLRPSYDVDDALTTSELIARNRGALERYYAELADESDEPMPEFRTWAAAQVECELFAQREARSLPDEQRKP